MTTIEQAYDARIADRALIRDPAQEAALPHLERIRAALANPPRKGLFRKPPPPKGLYLWGGVGRGKSMLMDLFVDTLTVPARRVHFHAFMQDVHAQMHVLRAKGTEDPVKPVAQGIADTARVLAFDEMQITDITDAMLVGRLFQLLFDKGCVVVTTSNRVPDDLYKDGLNRQLFLPFIALIKERMEVHELVSDRDHRQDRMAGTPVYFTPNDALARRQIDTVWDRLTHGIEEELCLTVQGRELTLPRYRAGVARARFFDLCGRPLGPADYLALAQALRVLVIEDIPQLSRRNFNEARRFVTLIDALYEARVRVIASAAARPEMLYIEGAGSFEFERTASRLIEMQSADWTTQDPGL
jgi:cell division protein ZapE